MASSVRRHVGPILARWRKLHENYREPIRSGPESSSTMSNLYQSKPPGSNGYGKRPHLAPAVRVSPRNFLCAFSSVLTDREKMVLHWLAEGLDVREIVQRVRRDPAILPVIGDA